MVASKTVKPHVALIPSPGMGHFIPLLEFAKRLVTHHDVHVSFLVITTTDPPSTAQDQLLNSQLPVGLHVINLPPVDVATVFRNNADSETPLGKICLLVEESLKSLKSVLTGLHPLNAVVVDMFTTSAFEICGELSIPAYSFFTASVNFFTFSLYLPTMDRDVEGEFIDLPEPIGVPGCFPIRLDDLLNEVRNRKKNDYKWILFHLSRLKFAAGVLLNSWEDIEPIPLNAIRVNPFYKEISTPSIYPIGPVIKQSEPLINSVHKKCLEWLDNQPANSVIFITLGSGGTLSTEQLTELALGLELSQQRFLWVVRKPNDATSCGALFGNGNEDNYAAYLPKGFLERTEGVGLVISSWGPQVEVLRHEATGGFLSHCGWNSSLESLSNGVPMIAWPLYAEQKMNATWLEEEIGVAVKPVAEKGKTVVGREEIERVVRIVMEGEEGKGLRCKAKALKESAAKALDFGGSSYESLCSVVENWKSKCSF